MGNKGILLKIKGSPKCCLDFTFYINGDFHIQGSDRQFQWKIANDTIYYKRMYECIGEDRWCRWEEWMPHTDLAPPKPSKVKHRLKKALENIDDILLGDSDE